MRRIAVTQRVEVIQSYGERRDCLDQKWSGLFEYLGFTLIPVPNGLQSPQAWLESMCVEGLVLSGGNDLSHLPKASNAAPERDFTETNILTWAANHHMPVLGVCRGMQMINHFLGGGLRPVNGHVACRHKVFGSEDLPFFARYQEVNSFHGWGISSKDLAHDLRATVWSESDEVEAFQHQVLPWVGVMWHPEREHPFCEHDKQLLSAIFEKQGI